MNSKITEFKRQSLWVLIGLTIITLTIYWVFWLRRQTNVLNRNLSTRTMSEWLFPSLLMLAVFDMGWRIPEALTSNDRDMVMIGQLLKTADVIFTVVWLFKVRNRLNRLFETQRGDKSWFGAVGTLVLGIFYLQFKLNRLHKQNDRDAQHALRSPEPVPT